MVTYTPTSPTSEFLNANREFVLDHRATKHPFLVAYGERGLPPEATRTCMVELYQFFDKYPFYLSILAGRIGDLTVLQEMIRILADESGAFSGRPHLEMYRGFLRDLGMSDEQIDGYQPLASSTGINEFVSGVYRNGALAEAVGVLFGLETMSSDMMQLLDDGMRVSGYSEEVRHFFMLHVDLEKNHSDESFSAAIPLLQNGSEGAVAEHKAQFEKGVREFMETLDRFWTNIGIRCNLTTA